MVECKQDENRAKCNCTYESCSRNGICCECISYHRKAGELPACYFSKEAEASYDRSIEKFVEDYKKRK